MKAALYCRLSKEDDKNGITAESESIQNQKALLLKYAQERDWTVTAVFSDEDYSGADRDRPGFRRLLAAARARYFDVLLVKTQSRFTRDMELVEKYLHHDFPLWGIRFIAVLDHVDTGIQGGKKARQINGLINEWYLEDLSENIRAVLDYKRQNGQFIGSFPVYGYQRDPDDRHRLLPDPEAAAVVRQIFAWYLAGEGTKQISDRLNREGIFSPARYKQHRGLLTAPPGEGRWTRTAVSRILRDQQYTGDLVQGKRRKLSYKSKELLTLSPEEWIVVPETHPPLIGKEAFAAVQDRLEAHTRTDGRGQRHPLAGKVFCIACGAPLNRVSVTSAGKRLSYLRCSRHCTDPETCTPHSVRLDRLETAIGSRLRELLQKVCPSAALPEPPRAGPQSPQHWQAEADKAKAEIDRRDQALRQLYLDKASGLISAEQFQSWASAYREEQADWKKRRDVCLARQEESPAVPAPKIPWEEDPLPPALLAAFLDRVSVGERDRRTGEQELQIVWRL